MTTHLYFSPEDILVVMLRRGKALYFFSATPKTDAVCRTNSDKFSLNHDLTPEK
jgi:hypothetical protein